MKTRTDYRLRNLRRARTLSQDDLARLIGITQETVSKYESGRLVPSPDVQARIAAILGTSVDALFGTDDVITQPAAVRQEAH